MATANWTFFHSSLLGRLANCKESLEGVTEEANLDAVEECIEELQFAIEEANARTVEKEEEEEDDDE